MRRRGPLDDLDAKTVDRRAQAARSLGHPAGRGASGETGTHKGYPLQEAWATRHPAAGLHPADRMCSLSRANVSSFLPNVSSFRPNVSSFSGRMCPVSGPMCTVSGRMCSVGRGMCSVFGGGRPLGSDVGEAGRLRAVLGVTGGKWRVASDERVAKSAWTGRGGSTAWTCYPRSRVPGCAQLGPPGTGHDNCARKRCLRRRRLTLAEGALTLSSNIPRRPPPSGGELAGFC